MKRVHIIGRKNHGKTKLVVELVQELQKRGIKVATIKHTHHEHELDTPGKDSHQHRIAGANAVGIVSRSMNAVFWEEPATDDQGGDAYAQFESFMANCDLILVEGDSQAKAAKIEVWRACNETEPMARNDDAIRLVVTDDPIDIDRSVLPRSDIRGIAEWIIQL